MTLIDRKYQELGGAGGALGRPVTDERSTPDGRGHFRHYEGGSIYATLQTDAHEIHGPIRDKWAALGWERSFLGYPETDELVAPDKRGHFNHFQEGSIYWTQETGAHEVHHAIREKWKELGWERGWLGYPLTDELEMPDGRGRYNLFQGGSIYWTPEKGARAKRRGSGDEKPPKVVFCSISGRAHGQGAKQASQFNVSLFGPNDSHAFRESQRFDSSGRYAFKGLPPGRYRLIVDSAGKTELFVGPHPSRRDVDCRGGAEKDVDFEIR
jgi:hypothetical protein